FKHDPKRKLLLVSRVGNGFIVPESELIANTRKGKQVMNVKLPDEALLCAPIDEAHDHLAVVGENRKMIIFASDQLPEMTRGKGVRLQKYKDGGTRDARTFTMAEGLAWQDSADRTFTKSKEELLEWMGERAQAGRMVPKGFPRNGKFGE
ncbi:MAG: DNA gyrase C-terminal beta-propeller domain-containing protein, partial [Salaquimonas sp.]